MQIQLRNEAISKSAIASVSNLSTDPIAAGVSVFGMMNLNGSFFNVDHIVFHPYDLYFVAVDQQGMAQLQVWDPSIKQSKETTVNPELFFSAAPLSHTSLLESSISSVLLADDHLVESCLVSATTDCSVFLSVPRSHPAFNADSDGVLAGFRPIAGDQPWNKIRGIWLPNAAGYAVSITDFSSLTVCQSYDVRGSDKPDDFALSLNWVSDHLLGVGTTQGVVQLFDKRSQTPTNVLSHGSKVSNILNFSQDANVFASCSTDSIQVHDLRNPTSVLTTITHSLPVVTTSAHGHGKFICSLYKQNLLKVFDVEGNTISTHVYRHQGFAPAASAQGMVFHKYRSLLGVFDDASCVALLANNTDFEPYNHGIQF
ncbi:hypothetical protein GEMRC1_003972 [Eukaryota sp. GEM-RC1]